MTDEADVKDDDNRPFTSAERKELRALMEQDKRAKWFWSTVRVWAGWGAAIASFVFVVKREFWK